MHFVHFFSKAEIEIWNVPSLLKVKHITNFLSLYSSYPESYKGKASSFTSQLEKPCLTSILQFILRF